MRGEEGHSKNRCPDIECPKCQDILPGSVTVLIAKTRSKIKKSGSNNDKKQEHTEIYPPQSTSNNTTISTTKKTTGQPDDVQRRHRRRRREHGIRFQCFIKSWKQKDNQWICLPTLKETFYLFELFPEMSS